MITGAAAEISSKVFFDLLIGRVRKLTNHGKHVHDKARAAKAALLAAFVCKEGSKFNRFLL